MSNRPSDNQGIRIYVGNLARTADTKELEMQFKAVGENVRFKPVNDRDTGECRGFGFINVNDEAIAATIIKEFHGREFAGNQLRVERSERKDANRGSTTSRRDGPAPAAKATRKVVHSEPAQSDAPDPRWSDKLSKLKLLLEERKAAV